ncbi:hypothetical protein BT96DRAFT_999086 [Gymnopus androsaceus JB14]|uniref:Uncharacterized protein n=1 Tax=Gymnopus androsaceus JB14 TaxID=1447944 RepID=A0A6A4H9F3_9AGAR|nr:hypothetical protein BT96DRAFT_999086 [Gymnopus androsaceus JB14]
MSPRNYFKSQNETKICKLARGMDGNFQTAWAKFWDELTVNEKKHWEEAAAEYKDIGQNQEELFGLLGLLLQALLKTGCIGNAEFLLLGAARYPDGELVTHHSVQREVLDPFTDWAETALRDNVFSCLIKCDEHNYPLFPKIDILHVPRDPMQHWLEMVFNHLYYKQYHEQLPCDQLTQSPDEFYNKNKYNFPEDLCQPTTMENIIDLRFAYAPTAAPAPTISTSATSEDAPVTSAVAPTAMASTSTALLDAPAPTPMVLMSIASEDAPVASAVAPTVTVLTSTASVDAPAPTLMVLTSTALEDNYATSVGALTAAASVDALAATPIALTLTGDNSTTPPSAATPMPAPTYTSSTTPENAPTTPIPSTLTPVTSSIPTPPPALENAPATSAAVLTPSISGINKLGRGRGRSKAENSETSAAGGTTRRSARNVIAGPLTGTGDAPVSMERPSWKCKADNGEILVQAPPGKKPKLGWVWVLELVQPIN